MYRPRISRTRTFLRSDGCACAWVRLNMTYIPAGWPGALIAEGETVERGGVSIARARADGGCEVNGNEALY
jgi:hypothetical protein